jgi:hypothetical protein
LNLWMDLRVHRIVLQPLSDHSYFQFCQISHISWRDFAGRDNFSILHVKIMNRHIAFWSILKLWKNAAGDYVSVYRYKVSTSVRIKRILFLNSLYRVEMSIWSCSIIFGGFWIAIQVHFSSYHNREVLHPFSGVELCLFLPFWVRLPHILAGGDLLR